MIIDNEFKGLIPPLTDEEYKGLEESILKDGCRDALVLWGDTLIDGHNRYEICTRHNIPFKTVQKEFTSRDEVMLWMLQNQLARRNLNDFQRSEIVHKCEDAVKAKAKERQRTSTGGTSPQLMEKFPEAEKSTSRDELGKMAGTSGKTYEHAVTVLEKAPEPVVQATRQNEISINSAYKVTKLDPEEQQEIAERIEHIEQEPKETQTPKAIVQEVLKRPHVSFNSGNNEWYTPSNIIEAARTAMGSIDVDPASNDIAQQTVKAGTYYTAETNGLDKEWAGNVWLNPPYASDLIGKFIDKLVSEKQNYNQAIVLVNNATETEWFNKIVSISSMVCFPKSRVKFYMPDGKTGAPLQGQAILYIGDNTDRFYEAYKEIGWVATLYRV